MNVKVIGIDLAKNVFQVCVQLEDGTILWNRKLKRDKLLHTLRQFPSTTLIAMEACGSSHYWGRTFLSLGFQVKLIPAQHVKPFVRRQKNDAHDALAICEAAFRPGLHPVSVKSVEQQDIKALRCVRRRMVEERTAKVNQIRTLAAEYGVIFPKGLQSLRIALPDAIDDSSNGLSPVMRSLLSGLRDDIKWLDRDIDDLNEQIERLCQLQPSYQRLRDIPGFGPILAAAFISEVGDGEQFANGRQLSAWCGLVPRQHSTGGKPNLGKITREGNVELRTLLIHGARAVLRHASKRQDALGQWVTGIIARRGKARAIVALANKLARIGWSLASSQSDFELKRAFKAA